MEKQFKVVDNSIVDSYSGKAVLSLSSGWESTLSFECKVLNKELVPNWVDGVLIWIPNYL